MKAHKFMLPMSMVNWNPVRIFNKTPFSIDLELLMHYKTELKNDSSEFEYFEKDQRKSL